MAGSLCLLLLSQGCATPPANLIPMPPNLDRPCPVGPPIPETDVELSVLFAIQAQREAAAAQCRAMHEASRHAWPR